MWKLDFSKRCLKGVWALARTLAVTGVLGCTSVQTSGYYTSTATVGVASLIRCEGPAQVHSVQKEDGSKTTIVSCNGEFVMQESSGFTGWSAVDAAIVAFVAWITFGGVTL